MTKTPYVAIGADELTEPLGDTIICERCGAVHAVEYGRRTDGTLDQGTAFVRCQGKTYLCGVDGKRWRARE